MCAYQLPVCSFLTSTFSSSFGQIGIELLLYAFEEVFDLRWVILALGASSELKASHSTTTSSLVKVS